MATVYADICADATEVTSEVGGTPGIDFGGTFVALAEDGMFVRAVSYAGSQFAIVKGYDTADAYLVNDSGTIVNLGTTRGNYPVAITMVNTSQVLAVWLESGTVYNHRRFNTALAPLEAAQAETVPLPVQNTVEGFLDLDSAGDPIWADPNRSLTVKTVPLVWPVVRGTYYVGLLGNALTQQVVGVNAITGKPSTLYDGTALRPHLTLADDGTTLYASWTEAPSGAAGFLTLTTFPAFTGQIAGMPYPNTTTPSQLSNPDLYPPIPHPVEDQRTKLMTPPWVRWVNAVVRQFSLPIDVGSSQIIGVLPPDHGGINQAPSAPDAGGITELTTDVVAVGPGVAVATIQPDVVTFAKMQNITTQRVIGRNTAGTGDPEEVTATQAIDWIGSTRGSVLYRGASGWAILTPGTADYVLTTHGSGADPTWAENTSGAYMPLTTGAEPMVFVSNGSGAPIMVAFTP